MSAVIPEDKDREDKDEIFYAVEVIPEDKDEIFYAVDVLQSAHLLCLVGCSYLNEETSLQLFLASYNKKIIGLLRNPL
jgi:hypothetical protein